MIALKPIQPHDVIATTDQSAWFGSWKNPYGPSENQPMTQLTRPNVGSSNQLKMIAVATVEQATGTKKAVRYRLMNRILEFSSTATPSPPRTTTGTKITVYSSVRTTADRKSGSWASAR